LAVCNGTAALHLALLANDIGNGDKVITTPFTFIASANCVLYTGARPVFVDIDRETYNMNPERIAEAIDDKTKAILAVHVFGVPCDMKAIADLCEDHELILIEDACEAIGSTYNGKAIGSFATSCFSFYPNKPITTAEGGMVLSDSDEIASTVAALRNQGRIGGDWLSHDIVGYNYRITDLQAALGVAQLRRIKSILHRRERAAQLYSDRLASIGLRTPPAIEGRSWFTYVVEVDDRDEVALRMNEKGIECKPYFPSVHLQKPYRALGFQEGDFPISEEVSSRVLALPFFSQISKAEIEFVVSTLRQCI